jgi:hypothetical protein
MAIALTISWHFGTELKGLKVLLTPSECWTYASWTTRLTPRALWIRNWNAFVLKFTYSSVANLIMSAHVSIPMPTIMVSFTLPIPGIFRTCYFFIKLIISSTVLPKYVSPLGLLTPQQILARSLLQAIPTLAVSPVCSKISYRILTPRKIFPS